MRFLIRPIGRLLARGFGSLADVGWSKGAKGNGIWLAGAILISGLRFVGRLGSRKRDVVFSRELLPGEVLNISHLLEDMKGRPAK